MGGVGITLTSADRVVICKSVFSVPWSTLLSTNQFSEQGQQKYSLSTPKNTWRSRQSREVARTRARFLSAALLIAKIQLVAQVSKSLRSMGWQFHSLDRNTYGMPLWSLQWSLRFFSLFAQEIHPTTRSWSLFVTLLNEKYNTECFFWVGDEKSLFLYAVDPSWNPATDAQAVDRWDSRK